VRIDIQPVRDRGICGRFGHHDQVKSALAVDDFLKSFEISVETYKGIVQLTGFVDSQKAVDKAGEVARGSKGQIRKE